MKLNLSCQALKDALAGFSRVVPSRSRLPVLGCVRIEAGRDGAVAEVTNLDEHLRCRLSASEATTIEPGVLIVPLQALKAFCKGGSHGTLLLESQKDDDATVSFNVGGHVLRRTVEGFPTDDWPALSSEIPTRPAPGFLCAFRRVAPFASTDATRPVLNTVHVDVGGKGTGNATLVATDGRRLTACNSLSLMLNREGIGVPVTKFLSWAALGEVCSIGASGVAARSQQAAGPQAAVTQATGPQAPVDTATWFALDAGPWSYRVRVPEGRYPNWRQVLPPRQGLRHRFVFADADVIVLRKVLPALPGNDELAVLGSPSGGLALAGADSGTDESRVSLEGGSTYQGPGARLLLNRHYLLDALDAGFRNFGCHEMNVPLRSDDGQGAIHVLMPLRDGRAEAAKPESETPVPETSPPDPLKPDTPVRDPAKPAAPKPAQPSDNPADTRKDDTMTTEEQPDKAPVSGLEAVQAAYEVAKARVREANSALADVASAIKDAVREDRQRRQEVETVRAGLQKLQAIRV